MLKVFLAATVGGKRLYTYFIEEIWCCVYNYINLLFMNAEGFHVVYDQCPFIEQ